MEAAKTPRLVASTADTYCCSIAESRVRERTFQDLQSEENQATGPLKEKPGDSEANYFKSAQWYALHILTSFNTYQSQVSRWHLSPHLKRRQHNPNLHPPSHSPRRSILSHNPHPIHSPHPPQLCQLCRPMPLLHPLRNQHDTLPLHAHRPSNPPHKQPLTIAHSSLHVLANLPHHRSIPHALIHPVVLPGSPFPHRHRLPNRPLRHIPQWRRACYKNAYHPIQAP
jgi:hypothetical protein